MSTKLYLTLFEMRQTELCPSVPLDWTELLAIRFGFQNSDIADDLD